MTEHPAHPEHTAHTEHAEHPEHPEHPGRPAHPEPSGDVETSPVDAPLVRQHPGADRAYVVGLLSFIGAVFVLPVLLGPYAWYLGLRVRREIDREPERWKGRGQATAGAALGAAASILLGLVVAAFVLVALWRQVELGLDTGYG